MNASVLVTLLSRSEFYTIRDSIPGGRGYLLVVFYQDVPCPVSDPCLTLIFLECVAFQTSLLVGSFGAGKRGGFLVEIRYFATATIYLRLVFDWSQGRYH